MKVVLAVVAALAISACQATTRTGSTTTSSIDAPPLASATITFNTLSDGKDTGSAVTVQLLRPGNELAAEVRSAGTEFDDNTSTPPLVMGLMGPFGKADAQEGSLRLRLTPQGRDTWTFNARLTLTFSDNTQQTFAWSGVRLDENAPERTLTLSGARA